MAEGLRITMAQTALINAAAALTCVQGNQRAAILHAAGPVLSRDDSLTGHPRADAVVSALQRVVDHDGARLRHTADAHLRRQSDLIQALRGPLERFFLWRMGQALDVINPQPAPEEVVE